MSQLGVAFVFKVLDKQRRSIGTDDFQRRNDRQPIARRHDGSYPRG